MLSMLLMFLVQERAEGFPEPPADLAPPAFSIQELRELPDWYERSCESGKVRHLLEWLKVLKRVYPYTPEMEALEQQLQWQLGYWRLLEQAHQNSHCEDALEHFLRQLCDYVGEGAYKQRWRPEAMPSWPPLPGTEKVPVVPGAAPAN